MTSHRSQRGVRGASPQSCRARYAALASADGCGLASGSRALTRPRSDEEDALQHDDDDALLDLLDEDEDEDVVADEAPGVGGDGQHAASPLAGAVPAALNVTGTGARLAGRTLAAAEDWAFDADAALASGEQELRRSLDAALGQARSTTTTSFQASGAAASSDTS